MNEKRFLVALGALSAALAACSSGAGGTDGTSDDGAGNAPNGTAGFSNGTAGGGPGPNPGTGGLGSVGSGGSTNVPGGGSGNGTSTGGGPPGGVTPTCSPGIPATTQIPRMLNRQYESAVRELLGVTTVGTSGQTPAQLLLADTGDSDMTADAWRLYQDVAAQIAKSVISGPNKAKFISCTATDAACMDTTIKTFGRKAFRRPLTDAEVARFKKLSEGMPAGTADEIAEATLQAFLVSPSFLLIPELQDTPAAGGTGIQLSSHEVASRLSFMLWGSVPDDMLNAAADANALQTKEQILAQAERMIQVRARTGPLVASFHREWAQMNNNSAHWWKMDHDKNLFPDYDAAQKVSWQAELNSFFEEVAFTNGSFKDLLLSTIGFVNKDNAAIYGLNPAEFGAELVKKELKDRPGFLTRAGFLASYSNYNASSPILRGAFVLTYLAGANPGPPIPGATMATVEGTFKTQREYVTELTKSSACAGCHDAINPIGYTLENFDSIGKWQTTDRRGGPIDSKAIVDLGTGEKIEMSSATELMTKIASIPKAQQIYAQSWVSYAFGRSPNANDQCVVDQLKTKLAQDGYSILGLLADLTQADSFRVRVAATP